MSDSLVIIPTYNEKENIADIIDAVLSQSYPFHILIVDDSSPDGTADIVSDLQDVYSSRLHLIIRKEKNGLGKAYIEGFGWAIEKGYDYIFEMDADFSHDPNDLERLLAPCKNGEADMSIGSRYINGVTVVNWPISRILLSYFASMYVKIITGIPIEDSTAGFICYQRNILCTLALNKVRLRGYGFQIEMKYRSWKHGFRLKEVPIIFKDREKGNSKLDSSIIFEAIFGVIGLKWKSIIGKL